MHKHDFILKTGTKAMTECIYSISSENIVVLWSAVCLFREERRRETY